MARILIVDDDPHVREMLRQHLEKAEYEIHEADDGDKGISCLRRHSIDLVITDVIMPRQEGISMLVAIRKEFPDVKVIAISGGGHISSEDYLDIAGKFGAIRTFSKPLKMEKLLAAVQDIAGVFVPDDVDKTE